ncbi:hypothetical protein BJF96_g9684 [Verticillium dahliae]|uniref:Large ribosomal subunit protein mL50 n=1 Tax=Verticillium dahliae TaxID=27337 RepID=A0AA45AH04_VERDA|nr:hypothetical protein VdG2_05818 [Verticillium dahliae VDG2]PNH26991.1 hypothetical protein BJF96_g9684 [Verticillium dahliae]PNH50949.1 hypothetical protein VD0003_g6270 [Verticillium dahliae]
MRRVTRIRAPRLLASSSPSTPLVSLRPISTTAPSSSDTTDRFRKLLWKGKAPGPADPYAQQPESSSYQQPDLEAYEAELAELESQTRDLGSLFPNAASSKTRPSRPFSRLKTSFKPTRAPEVNDVGINGYTPALSAEGLEEVGGYEGWWEREGHWGPESEYTPFAAAERVQDAAVLEVLTRQAVVEALAFRKERDEIRLSADWAGTDRAALDRALALRIKITEDGIVALRGNTNAVVKGLAPTKRQLKLARKEKQAQTAGEAVLAEDATTEAEEATVLGQHVSPEEARELVATWDAEWKDISLADPLLKFAINKRVFQLTGHLLPDPKLARAQTVRHILNLIVRPPPAKKLVETLQRRGELFALPNVSVYARRITPIDREKEVGRWKLIEKELAKRDLPVTGHAGLEKHREASWVQGGL